MIVTATPAPAIDWTVHLDRLELGEVNRAESLSREASGKGLNVSWALHKQGVRTTAVFPSGGPGGDFVTAALVDGGLNHVAVPVQADIRTNMTLRLTGIPETKINTHSAELSPSEVQDFIDALSREMVGARAVLSCGSLPPGAPDTLHRDIIFRGHAAGIFTALDTSGAPLRRALEAKPGLLKPNLWELEQITGQALASVGDVVAACGSLLERGVGMVLASLGSQGVVFVDSEGALRGSVAGVNVVNTVGAGDALLAGFIAHDDQREAKLARALLWASSSVQSALTLFEVDPSIGDAIAVSDDFDSAEQVVR